MTRFASITSIILGTLLSLTSAHSGCRCAPYEFLSIPHQNLSIPESVRPCAPYKILDARGTAERPGVSLMFRLGIEHILTNRTDIVSQSIIYPAAFDQNVTLGVNYMTETIKVGLEDCPNQKYFLLGYSQGASVVLETLEGLNTDCTEAIAGVILVGNPFRMPGRLSNVDETDQRDNRTTFGMGALQAKKTNSSIPAYSDELDRSGRVLDICLENDTICSADPACPCQLTKGQIATDHLSYGMMQDVQNLIVKHINDYALKQ